MAILKIYWDENNVYLKSDSYGLIEIDKITLENIAVDFGICKTTYE